MPAAIPLIAGAFLAAGSIATAIGITTAFVVAGLTISLAAVLTITGVALLAVSYLTRKTPKPESSASGQQLQQKLDPQAPVPIAYGRTATGGFITWRGTWGAKNAMYGIVTVLSAGGPIQGVEAYQAGDYSTGFSGNPATSLSTVASVGGYSNGSKLYINKLHQRWQTGEAPANTTPGGATGYPIPAGPMSGLAHVITGYEYNQEAFPSGLPACLWVLQGVKLYDPRKDSTYPGGSGAQRRDQPSTWTFSENPFLAGLQWTLGRYENGHRVYGIGAKWEEVDVASFVAGANVADANGWKVGGVVTTSDDKFAVLASLLVAGGGVAVARGAQIACTFNGPKVATLTITTDDIIGDVETSSSTSWRDRQNTIIPRYREESQNWEIISGERVSAASYVTEDEDTKTVEIEYPLVQNAKQAHQLAAYELVNSREFLTFNLTGKLRLMAARVGEAVMLNAPELSATSKKCTVVGREVNPSDNSVTLSLKAETDAKHAFALGQSQIAPPSPKLDAYDPSNPAAPAANAWAVTATQISTSTTTLPVIVISGATDDPNATTVIVEYRPQGSSVWLPSGEYPATVTRVEVGNLTDGTIYELALSYRTVRNIVGARRQLVATAGAFRLDYGSINGTPTIRSWAAGTAYKVFDVVTYGGASYYVTGAHIASTPPPGANYEVFAAKGTNGTNGTNGGVGEKGDKGDKGDSAFTGYLTNESHTLPADTSGNVTSFTGAGGQFRVLNGAVDVTASCTFAINGASNNTSAFLAPIDSAGNYACSALNPPLDTAWVDYQATFQGTVIVRRFTISKSKAGSNGQPAQLISLAGPQVLRLNADGSLPPGTPNMIYTATRQNISAGTGFNTTPSHNLTLGGGSVSGDVLTVTAARMREVLLFNRDTLAQGAVIKIIASAGSLSDELTINAVFDGGKGDPGAPGTSPYTMILTNEAHTVPADSAGNVTSYSGAATNIVVYYGNSDVTSAFSVAASPSNPQGLSITGTYPSFQLSGGFDANEDVATFTIRVVGSGGHSGITLDKVWSFAKSKAGPQGGVGPAGGTGPAGGVGPVGGTGPQGGQGNPGANAKLIVVTSTHQTVNLDAAGAVIPQTTTFTAVVQNPAGGTPVWRMLDANGSPRTGWGYANTLAPALGGTSSSYYDMSFSAAQLVAHMNATGTPGQIFEVAFDNDYSVGDRISIVKVRDGTKGTDGQPGTPAVGMGLTGSQQVATFNSDGSLVAGQSVAFTAVRQNTGGNTVWTLYDANRTPIGQGYAAAFVASYGGDKWTSSDNDHLTLNATGIVHFFANYIGPFSMRATVEGTGVFDEVSFSKVTNGATGAPGSTSGGVTLAGGFASTLGPVRLSRGQAANLYAHNATRLYRGSDGDDMYIDFYYSTTPDGTFYNFASVYAGVAYYNQGADAAAGTDFTNTGDVQDFYFRVAGGSFGAGRTADSFKVQYG